MERTAKPLQRSLVLWAALWLAAGHHPATAQPAPAPSPTPTPTSAPPTRTPVDFEATVHGTLGPNDPGLDGFLPLQAPVPWPTDAYTIQVPAGQALIVGVSGDVDLMLTIFDDQHPNPPSAWFAGAHQTLFFAYVAPADATATILVASTTGTWGSYTMQTHQPTAEELDAYYAALPVEAVLEDGVAHDATVPCTQFSDYVHSYAVDVPAGTSALSIEAHSRENVDIFVRRGRPLLNLEVDAEYTAADIGGDESLRIGLTNSPPLQAGRYFVTVLVLIPFTDHATHCPADFTVTAHLTRTLVTNDPVVDRLAPPTESRVEGPFGGLLTAGRPASGRILPARPYQVWSISVPEGTRMIDVQTRHATGRLELVALAPGQPRPTTPEEFLAEPYRAFSARDDERLAIRPGPDETALAAGAWTLFVFDLQSAATSDYEIVASEDEPVAPEPPYTPPSAAELASLTPLQRAVRATVQIAVSPTEGTLATGSGTVLTPDGIILTNHHVIGSCEGSEYLFGCTGDIYRNPDGTPADLFIGVSNESQSSSEQEYIGHVIRTLPDADLALVQIVSDLDGRPAELPIPFAPVAPEANAVSLADGVDAIGYPAVAGAGGRISLTVTQGIITGFSDDHGQRALLNIDANIGHGNSGGALVNAAGVLVGVPSNLRVMVEDGDRQNYARSLTLIPPEWLAVLRDHGADVR